MGGGKSIQFKTGDNNQTYHITIKQDQLCEMEFFYVNIDLNSDVQPLDVNISQAKVFINDSNKPECGKGPIFCNFINVHSSHMTSIDYVYRKTSFHALYHICI